MCMTTKIHLSRLGVDMSMAGVHRFTNLAKCATDDKNRRFGWLVYCVLEEYERAIVISTSVQLWKLR